MSIGMRHLECQFPAQQVPSCRSTSNSGTIPPLNIALLVYFFPSFLLAIITPDLALGVAPMGAYTVCYLKIASVDCCHEFPPILVYINPVDWGLDWRLLRAKASPPRRALVPYFDRLPACPAFGIKFDGHSCLVNGCTNLGAL